ncbi:hypothetical protein B296_00021216, partial [Ensete ventricosum]
SSDSGWSCLSVVSTQASVDLSIRPFRSTDGLVEGSGIVLTQDLFLSCFHLCRGQGGYYLTSQAGFRVGGVPSNNKGWKARFLFISRHQGWDFDIEWSAHPVSNVPSNLSDEETNLIEQLKIILSASQAIRSLTEEWLVETGLSPTSHGMPCLFTYEYRWEDPVGQRKRDRRKSPRKADRVAAKGKSPADVSEEPLASRRRPKSVRELCSANARVDGRDYHAIRMCNIPEKAPVGPLEADLRPLTHGMLVWQNGEASAKYIQGTLIPRLAIDLYTLSSEVLIDGAVKAMVLSLVEHLRVELDEVNNHRPLVEADLEIARVELANLQRQLADLQEQLDDSEGQLRGARAQVRQMETELLELTRSKDALREDLPKRAI